MNRKNKIITDIFAQFIHDISNIVQNMMIASYERQIGGTGMIKIDKGIHDLKKSIEIYRSCFLDRLDYPRFEQIIEDISLLYGREIELEEEGHPPECILEILCVYCIWIAKNEPISYIFLSQKKSFIQLADSKNLESYMDNQGLRLKYIIDQISKSNNLLIYSNNQEARIFIESQPFVS